MNKINWQQPFVNIFKHFAIESDKNANKSGDVTTLMDSQIKCKVYKISGHASASNFISMPKLSGHSLGLTGRYIYIIFKPAPSKHFTIHVDVMTVERALVRVSFSTSFREFKSTPTWLQFPYVIQSAIDQHAAGGPGRELCGGASTAPMHTKWTVLCVDLNTLIRIYSNRTFECLRGFKLCSSMFVKNVITSDVVYEPGVTYAEQKAKQATARVNAFPREVCLPCEKGEEWSKFYEYVAFPSESSRGRPFDSAGQSRILIQSEPEPRRSDVRQTFTSASGAGSQTSVISHSAIDSATFRSRQANSAPQMSLNLPLVGVPKNDDDENHKESEEIDLTEDALKQQNEQDIHVYPGNRPDSLTSSSSSLCSLDAYHRKTPIMESAATQNEQQHQSVECKTSLEPDPILKLSKIIGFDTTTSKAMMRWSRDSQYLVYASKAIVIGYHLATQRQFCFVGHADRVSCVALSPDSSMLASGQVGPFALVRIWHFDTQRCLAIFRNHEQSLQLLEYSACGSYLCGVGKDKQGKTMLVVWDVSQVGKSLSSNKNSENKNSNNLVKAVAKAHTDTHINRILFLPYDSTRLISCGRDNVRFWRLRPSDASASLRSCALNLSPYIQALNRGCSESEQRNFLEFTDMAINGENNLAYACTRNGQIFVLNAARMEIENVRVLEPVIEKASGGGILVNKESQRRSTALQLNSLTVSGRFCVTGSEDGYVRVWPLDFSQVSIEAEHESPVGAVRFSPDSFKIATATATGNLGILDVQAKEYVTIVRSHTDTILDVSIDSSNKYLATCSSDSSVRVWSLETSAQLYYFTEPNDRPTRLCFHPLNINDRTVFACGFTSGKLRLFNVTEVKLFTELRSPHLTTSKAEITDLAYTSDGKRLLCADSLKHLSLFNVEREYALIRVLPNATLDGRLTLSPDDRYVAVIGPGQSMISIFDCQALNEALRVNVASEYGLAVRLAYSPSQLNHLLCATASNKLLRFDARTGRLLSSVNNIHRSSVDFISVSSDGQYLITSGDNFVKIWDYQMRLDNNYQTFIGHSSAINRILLTSDSKRLISVGDSIIFWDFLAYHSDENRNKTAIKMPSHGRQQVAKVNYNVVRERSESSRNRVGMVNQPLKDYNAFKVLNETSFEEMRSKTTVSKKLTKQTTTSKEMFHNVTLERPRTPPVATEARSDSIAFVANEIDDTFYNEDPSIATTSKKAASTRYQDLPNLLRINDNKTTIETAKSCVNDDILSTLRPSALKHLQAREKDSLIAKKRSVVSDPSKASLKLASVLGYNGKHAGENIVWTNSNPDYFAYSVGSVLCVENVKNGKQELLHHPYQEDITAVCMKRDSSEIASASSVNVSFDTSSQPKCQIIVWNVSRMNILMSLFHRNASNITSLKYSNDDRYLISVSDYKCPSLVVWRASDSSYSTLVFIDCLSYVVNDLAWSPFKMNEFCMAGPDKTLVVCAVEEKLALPGLKSSSPCANLKFNEFDVPLSISEQQGTNFEFTSLAYGENQLIFAATNQGYITVWNMKTNSCLLQWRGDVSEIGVLVCSKNKLISGSVKGSLKLWNITNIYSFSPVDKKLEGLVIDDELQLSSGIKCCRFDQALETGFVSTENCTIWFINWSESENDTDCQKQNKPMVSSHTDKINNIACINDRYVSTVGDDGSLIIWSSQDGERIFQVDEKPLQAICQSLLYLSDERLFKSVAKYSKTSNSDCFPLILVGYSDGSVRLYDIDKRVRISKLIVANSPITCLNHCEKTGNILVGSLDGQLYIIDLSQGSVTQSITDHKGAPITSLDSVLQPDDKHIWLAASRDRRVSVWSSISPPPQIIDWLTFPAPNFTSSTASDWLKYPPSLAAFERPKNIRISDTKIETIIYSGYGLNKEIIIYNFIKKQTVRSIGLSEWPECWSNAPNRANLLAIGTKSRLLQMKELKSGVYQDFALHSDKISSVCFSKDGKRLFSASFNEIFIWDVKV